MRSTINTPKLAVATAVAALALAIIPMDTAVAQRGGGTVSSCSNFGKGCATAAVRSNRGRTELRLPGGTWIDCAGNCKDRLRVETVDFWAQREFERAGSEPRRRP